MHMTMPEAEYLAFPVARDAGADALAALAVPAFSASTEVLRDGFAGLLGTGGALRRILPGIDGAPRHVTALLLGDGGELRYLLLALRDPANPALTEVWLEAERLEAAARAGGAIGHSVNNALTAILGNADYLAETAGLPEDASEAASLVVTASERLEGLMRRTARLSRAVRPPEGASKPCAVLRRLVERCRAGLPPGIRLDAVQGPEPGTLLVDPDLLEAVLGEAVANSAAALGEAGRIHLTATLVPGATWPGFRWLAIAVRDDGPGFPAALMAGPQAFSQAARGGGGPALGLPILRGFAEAMGGTLTLANWPGGGSRLVLRLPILADAEQRVPEPSLQRDTGEPH